MCVWKEGIMCGYGGCACDKPSIERLFSAMGYVPVDLDKSPLWCGPDDVEVVRQKAEERRKPFLDAGATI